MKGSTTPEERRNIREQTKVNNQKFEQTVTAFLTPDQKTKLDKMKEERKARRNKHRRAQGFGPSERGMDNVQQSPSPN